MAMIEAREERVKSTGVLGFAEGAGGKTQRFSVKKIRVV